MDTKIHWMDAAAGVVRPLVPLQLAGIVESGFCLRVREIADTGQSTSSKAESRSLRTRELRLAFCCNLCAVRVRLMSDDRRSLGALGPPKVQDNRKIQGRLCQSPPHHTQLAPSFSRPFGISC